MSQDFSLANLDPQVMALAGALVLLVAISLAISFYLKKTKLAIALATREQELLELKAAVEAFEARLEESQAITSRQEAELASQEASLTETREAHSSLKAEHQTLQEAHGRLREQAAELKILQQQEAKHAEEKLESLLQAKAQMTAEFKTLAQDIFEDKTQRFNEQSKAQIETVLKPLNTKLQDFQKQVADTYDKESKQRFSLEEEVRKLQALNLKMSDDAVNLTNALKGDSKVQGSFGELKLERILEASGLSKGREYEAQVSLKDEDGKRLQPDVVVYLPENKAVIIDSKMSLTAYHRFVSTEDESEREQALQQHLQSINNHIKSLGSKSYQQLPDLRTLDFVLMFLPIEDAFSLAVQRDPNLFAAAFEKNIILVGPSTLLATLRTIHSIWRHEYQNQNALEIARQAGNLYDKFANFVKDMDELGGVLRKSQQTYEQARRKLESGHGNLISRTENLKKLGAKASKQLPEDSVARAKEGDRTSQGLNLVDGTGDD